MAGTIESGERFGLAQLPPASRADRPRHASRLLLVSPRRRPKNRRTTEGVRDHRRRLQTCRDRLSPSRSRRAFRHAAARAAAAPRGRLAAGRRAFGRSPPRRDSADCRRSRPQPAAARGLAATDVGGVREGAGTGGRRARGRLLRRRPCVGSPRQAVATSIELAQESSRGLQTSATIGSFTMVFSLLPRSCWRGMSAAVSAGMTRPRRR